MKYIRTKDGRIFEIEKDLGKYGKSKAVIICDFNGNFIDVEKQNMILKQADTIEELCDYVFYYDSQNELCIIDLKKANLYCLKGSLEDGLIRDVKLAILTDKGLIYVAKFNSEGDLELL